MRKKIVAFMAMLCCSFVLHAQNDCKFNGNYERILSELNKRNNGTGKHKLTREELSSIANYWVVDCKCRNGVSTMEEARALYNEGFSYNGGYDRTLVEKGRIINRDLSPFRDLLPPLAVFTASSCVKGSGQSNFGSSLENSTDCVPEASRLKNLDGQLGAYAGQFFVAYCQCKNGVPSKDYADQLIATMKINHQHFNQFKNAATPALSTAPLTTCKIASGTGVSGGAEPHFLFKGAVINQQFMGYLGELAESSDNPTFKRMVGEMQEVSSTISETRNTMNTWGLNTAEHDQFMNLMENAGHAIAIGKALFGKPPTLEEQLSESQLKARSFISDLMHKVEETHKNATKIHRLSPQDRNLLEKIEDEKKNFAEYDFYTSATRLLIVEWFMNDGYMDVQQLKAMQSRIENMTYSEILQRIDRFSNSYLNKKHYYLLNQEIAFKRENNRMNLILARHYEEKGDKARAQKILESLDFDVTAKEAPALIYESFINHQHMAAANYYYSLKAHLMKSGMIYFGIFEGIDDYDPLSIQSELGSIYRERLFFVLNLGVMSMIYSGNLTQAKEELAFISEFNNDVLEFKNPKKLRRHKYLTMENNQYVDRYLQSGEALVNLTQNLYRSKSGGEYIPVDSFNANTIDKLTMLGYSTMLDMDFIKVQTDLIYLNILINSNQWDMAMKQSIDILRKSNDPDLYYYKDNPLFSGAHIRIEQAFIYYKKGDLKKAESILKLLQMSEMSDERIHVLSSLISAQHKQNNK